MNFLWQPFLLLIFVSLDFKMPDQATKSDVGDLHHEIQETLRITVRKRASLRSLFTKEDRRISTYLDQNDRSAETIQLLTVILGKLKNAKENISQFDEEIQDNHARLENYEAADADFHESDMLSDNHSLLIQRLEEYVKPSNLFTRNFSDENRHPRQAKHSAVKLPKMVLPTFDGNRRKWISFWDVFKSEIHECDDISNVSKFNFLRGQLSEDVKKRVEGILASDDNYHLLVTTLQDNYGNRTAIKNAHCVALCSIAKPQYTASSLRTFYDTINGDIRSLHTLGLSDKNYGSFYVPIMLEKIPSDALTNLLEKYPDDNPTLQELMEFLHAEVKKLEQVAYFSQQQETKTKSVPPQSKVQHQETSSRPPSGSATTLSASYKSSESKKGKAFNRPMRNCSICKASHNTFQCTLSTEERMSAVVSAHLCLNCLKPTHLVAQCPSKWRCSVCREPHHTSLHGASALQNSMPKTAPKKVPSGITAITQSLNLDKTLPDCTEVPVHRPTFSPVLLKTAIALVRNHDKTLPANIFVDEGSSMTYSTSRISSNLDVVPYANRFVKVDTFGGKSIRQRFPVCSFDVITDDGPITIDTLIKDTIVQPINCEHWSESLKEPHIQGLPLADKFESSTFAVDILLGVDTAWKFLKPDIISGFPTAQASSFGYILSGPLKSSFNDGNQHRTLSLAVDSNNTPDISWFPTTSSDVDLHNQVELSLGSDNLGIKESTEVVKDDGFIQRFVSQIEYHQKIYYVPLPWLDNHPNLPSNLSIALNRLEQVKKRLLKLHLWDAYNKIIQDQLQKEYVEPVEPDKEWDEVNSHYLSHFFVLRSNSETTPLRVVFAANAGRYSLNDCLQTGPCLLRSLHELLQRFRTQKYAFVADIEKAFLRIKLLPEDRDFVRFLWFQDGDPNKPIRVYRYTSVFFGGTSSPFILNAVILFHLNKFSNSPISFVSDVASDLQEKFYCDNALSGQPDEDSAVSYYKVARDIMGKADMNLRQWFSNSEKLQQVVNDESTGSAAATSGLVGMEWDYYRDVIQFPQKKLIIPCLEELTKRQVLSLASSTFDPIGLISPVTVLARRFLSTLWEQKLEWDQTLPPDQQKEFKDILSEVQQAMQYEVPRYLNLDPEREVQLHTFCDASPNSAAACTCFLVQDQHVILVGSKYKVASKKHPHTVPRWELIAMLIGSRLADALRQIFIKDFRSITSYFWTDSTICLYWLNSTKKLSVFIENRKKEIRQLTDVHNWSHVRSEDNVADLPSRGCTANELFRSELWHQGPKWLPFPEQWPSWKLPLHDIDENIYITLTAVESNIPANYNVFDATRVNSFNSLLRIAAYVNRFITNSQKIGSSRNFSSLSLSEINAAEILVLASHQREYYTAELSYLQNGAKSIPILVRQLNLQLNPNGLLCAPGRLEHVLLNDRARMPILLSKNSRLTDLVIESIHKKQLHAGVNSTVIALRKSYWVPSARRQVGRVLKKCVTCKRNIGKPYILPDSPSLPDFRLNKLKPFSSIGVDYTGHLFTKASKNKRNKCYVCLFACSTTRNVNLEVVTDLTADQFVQALRRHSSVYGIPEHMICDNAKTFLKAEEDLRSLFNIVSDQHVQSHLRKNKIIIHHIPVKSPHWGGMYERLIGVIKLSLKKVLGRALVSLGELQTIIKEVQAVVNDRPLTFVSNSSDDPEPLTPSKLLLGFDVTPLPHPSYDEDVLTDEDFSTHTNLNRAAVRRSTLYQHFVNRFQSEYYSTLRERHFYQTKRQASTDEIVRTGDIVLVHNSDCPRLLWKLAIVQKLLRGQDGKIRAAQIKTDNGISSRSLHLLYPLEVTLSDPRDFFKSVDTKKIPQIELRRSKRIAEKASSVPRPQYVESV